MKITTLIENTTIRNDLLFEHGLSLYIEDKDLKLLFDTGASDAYWSNANKLGIDLKKCEFLVVSHGHYDHTGGLKKFVEENRKANIYIHEKAFEKHYSLRNNEMVDIGVAVKNSKMMILTNDYYEINQKLLLFSKIDKHEIKLSSNDTLYQENNQLDDFKHEQNLIIKGNKNILIAGCAHNGITNIMKKANEYVKIDIVIGGFHLYNKAKNVIEPFETIQKIALELLTYDAIYYTGHCTGSDGYVALKGIMKDRINEIKTGITIEV